MEVCCVCCACCEGGVEEVEEEGEGEGEGGEHDELTDEGMD